MVAFGVEGSRLKSYKEIQNLEKSEVHCTYVDMDVSKNRGTPKRMVKIMEIPIKMDALGVPLFSETSVYIYI